MNLLLDTHVWYLISFVLFCGVVWKYGWPSFMNLIDNRIDAIREEIEKAESLRTEAHELLAQYQRKHRDAVQEADQIVKNAEKQAAEIKLHAETEIKETIDLREKQLKERIARMEEKAIEDIREHTANLAVQATAEIIAETLDKKANQNLINESIKSVGSKL